MRGRRTTGTKLLRAEEPQQSPTISLALSVGSPRRCSGSDHPERVLVTSVNPGPFGVSVGTSTMADLLAKVMLCAVLNVFVQHRGSEWPVPRGFSIKYDVILCLRSNRARPQIRPYDLKSGSAVLNPPPPDAEA